MDWLATLRRSGGIDALARQTGSRPADVQAATAKLLPALLRGLNRYARAQAAGGEGGRALLAYFASLGDGKLAADVMAQDQLDSAPGEAILDRILGGGGDRRRLLEAAARACLLDLALLDRLLPALAMLLCGYIAACIEAGGDLDWLRDALALPPDDAARKDLSAAES
jgi:hypothetical protein